MGTAPTPVLVSASGAGNPTDGQITRDPIDDLIGAMSSHLLIYLRASKVPVASSFRDSLGNAVTAATSGVTKNNSDSNFNGKPSITFNNAINQYAMAAGGIGVGTSPVGMTNSFTLMAGIRAGNDAANSLYGDTAGTNGSSNLTGVYLNSVGNLAMLIGGAGLSFSGGQPLLAPGATGSVWISYDAATNIVRAGVNSASIQLFGTSTNTRNGAGTSTVCYPFGYQNSGNAGNQSFNRWCLFNKAYMNGAAPSDDAAFTNLIAVYAANI